MAIGKSNANKVMQENLNKAVIHTESSKGTNKVKSITYGHSTDEVAPYTVYRTYNYSKFKKMKGNRKVSEERVNTIIQSIRSIGRLPTPIVVNEKMEIIEGQGRYEACKRLGLPIEYIIVMGANIGDCRVINQANTPWGEEDYIDSHIESGNTNYINAKALHDLGFTYLGIFDFAYNYLHCGAVKKRTYCGGEFKLPEDTFNFVKDNAEILQSFGEFTDILGARKEQVQAIVYWMMRYKGINIERLRKNISNLEVIILTNGRGKTTRSYPRAISQHATKNVENLFNFIIDVYNDGYSSKNQFDAEVMYKEVENSRLKATYGKQPTI